MLLSFFYPFDNLYSVIIIIFLYSIFVIILMFYLFIIFIIKILLIRIESRFFALMFDYIFILIRYISIKFGDNHLRIGFLLNYSKLFIFKIEYLYCYPDFSSVIMNCHSSILLLHIIILIYVVDLMSNHY